MRETTLGLWMVRLAVTIGAGAMALGLSTVSAQASVGSHASGFASLPGSVQMVSSVDAVKAQPEPIFVTEDFDWG
jgi:serine acetyltransferase